MTGLNNVDEAPALLQGESVRPVESKRLSQLVPDERSVHRVEMLSLFVEKPRVVDGTNKRVPFARTLISERLNSLY